MWRFPIRRRHLAFGFFVMAAWSQLPPLRATCNEMRAMVPTIILQETGPWRCVEIPGFLIYSRLSDDMFRNFANELRQHNLQLAALTPDGQPFLTLSNQIPVVLRVSDDPNIAFNRTKQVQVYDDEVWLIYVVELPRVMPDPAATSSATTQAIPLGQILGLPASPGIVGPASPAEILARDAFWRRLTYTRPPAPQWLQHGLERLMSEIRISRNGLALGRPTTRPNVPEVGIDELFVDDYSHDDPNRHEALTRQSALFLRWAMVIDQKRRETLWKFAARTAQSDQPIGEETVMAAFDMTYGQIAVELTDPQLHRANVAGSGNTSNLQLADVREASEEEVDRLIHTINGINERAISHNADIASAR